MPNEVRIRNAAESRNPLEDRGQRFATKAELDDLIARLNLLEFGGVTADKIGGGTIGTQNIRLAADGLIFAADEAGNGFTLNAEGLAFFDGFGLTIYLSANGGGALFSGNILANSFRTSSTGERIEIDEGVNDSIQFFTGDAAETQPGAILSDADANLLQIGISAPRGSSDYAQMTVFSDKNPGVGHAGMAVQAFDSSNVSKGAFSFSSVDGAYFDSGLAAFVVDVTGVAVIEAATRIRLATQTGYVEVERLATTNNLQLQFTGPISGSSAIGIDGPATGNQLNVQSQTGTTAQPISASAFNVVSGRDTKSNIKSRPGGALAKVKNLRAVNFEREDDKLTGFVAEEMNEHFPEAVFKKTDGTPHSIDLMAVVALLTQAVQELSED